LQEIVKLNGHGKLTGVHKSSDIIVLVWKIIKKFIGFRFYARDASSAFQYLLETSITEI